MTVEADKTDAAIDLEERVATLQQCIADGDNSANTIAYIVRQVLDTGAWRRFHTPNGAPVAPLTFEEFVITPRHKGLGTTVHALAAWVGVHEPELAQRIDTAWKADVEPAAPQGRPSKGKARDTRFSHHDATPGIVARLKRDHPDVAAEVVAGRMTANAAARQFGWRNPRIVVSSPEAVARSLRRHLTPDQRRTLARLLLDDQEDTG